jgi:DNA-binding IclR family transcriptional regulator
LYAAWRPRIGGKSIELTLAQIDVTPLQRHHLPAPQIRQRGWALADQESEEGVRSVAAPIWDRSDHVTAAINVSAHASRVSLRELRRHHLPIDASRISRDETPETRSPNAPPH